jgi:DNA-binding NtrC family response regulator
MPLVLVVDDEPGVRESLRMLFKGECEVQTAENVDAALRAYAERRPDAILLDLVMPGRGGLDLLAELRERPDPPPVVVLTATKTVATAVEAMKLGAADYVTKPFEVEALRLKVRRLFEHRALQQEVVRLRDEVRARQSLGRLVGRAPSMQAVFRAIERVAQSMATVLISGESGTGKELVARAIHELGPRAAGPFVAVNVGAIPEALVESELFGHERGAFTDARERRIGRFELASGGTLFFDEIGELGAAVQVKLLRALQERSIERLGSGDPIPVDVRVVAATNRDLQREVDAGRFRPDLYYRIHVVPIALPPLRERREDVRLIAEHYLARQSERRGGGAARPVAIAPDALAALERHDWPGNVRELENALEHGLALCSGDRIELADLPAAVVRSGGSAGLRDEWRAGRVGFEEALARFEIDLLRDALERCGWNQTRAAHALGITRRVLKLKIDRFGIKAPETGEA